MSLHAPLIIVKFLAAAESRLRQPRSALSLSSLSLWGSQSKPYAVQFKRPPYSRRQSSSKILLFTQLRAKLHDTSNRARVRSLDRSKPRSVARQSMSPSQRGSISSHELCDPDILISIIRARVTLPLIGRNKSNIAIHD